MAEGTMGPRCARCGSTELPLTAHSTGEVSGHPTLPVYRVEFWCDRCDGQRDALATLATGERPACTHTKRECIPLTDGREGEMCQTCGEWVQYRSGCCIGERCGMCGRAAVGKVEEVIFGDDPQPHRHPLTQYLCTEHMRAVLRPYATLPPAGAR